MNRSRTALRKLLECERGGVLMEYVIIMLAVCLPLLGVVHVGFNPTGGEVVFDPTGSGAGTNFGVLGNAFVDWYQRIVCGIALPMP